MQSYSKRVCRVSICSVGTFFTEAMQKHDLESEQEEEILEGITYLVNDTEE